MKLKLLSTIFLLLSYTAINPIYAQTWCLDLPSTVEEIEACNRGIARAFAPILNQYANPDHGNSVSGNGDRILKVNYDVNPNNTPNWVATDNWDNLVNVGNPSSSQYDVRPHGYYAVTWTEESWIIVYSFYYARDWADEDPECNEDEHEGDMAKVFVVVKRPDSATQPPEEMLLGFKTTTPDGLYSNSETCPTETNVKVIEPFHNSTTALGAHPVIWSSSGSHHYYLSPTLAEWDEHTLQLCRVHGDTKIIYHPPADDSDITTTLLEIDNQKEYYGLIDIFDVDEGLWVQRTTGTLFNQEEPLHAQHFLCDDGEGCGVNEGGLIDFGPEGTPWAPWTGSWGLNPLKEILINGFNDFDCECTNAINEGCGENTVLTSDAYVCNLYLCELYEIIMPEEFLCDGVLTKNPTESNNTVFVNFQLSAAGVFPNAEVTWCWELPPGFDNPVSCVGCSQAPVNNCVKTGGDIVLKIENASLQQLWNNPENFVVTASTNLLECGEINKEFPFKVQLLGLVSTDTADCEKMVFEVKEGWHIDGNVYSWDFPLYDALATVSNGGRRVEFSTVGYPTNFGNNQP